MTDSIQTELILHKRCYSALWLNGVARNLQRLPEKRGITRSLFVKQHEEAVNNMKNILELVNEVKALIARKELTPELSRKYLKLLVY